MQDNYQDFKDLLPEWVKTEQDFGHYKVLHSAEHVFVQAIKELFPKQVFPAVAHLAENTFANDARWQTPLSEADLPKIEQKMQQIINANLPIVRKEVSIEEARELMKDNPFKLEWIEEHAAAGKTLTVYWTGDVYVDLCKGPHVDSTGEVKAFKLLSIAGAYWRGDENNEMLTRVYGTAFGSKEELEKYLWQQEEAKKRDHRKIGEDLSLYFIDEMVGKGLVMWLPNGEIVKNQIEQLAIEMEAASGYQRVSTPHIAKQELFQTSGHLPYYKDSMYPPMEMDDGIYYLKAMNCPHHHRIFLHKPRSYRELPLRLAEYGTVYRNELSGTLAGLLRVRGMGMNDAHIYCTKEQVKAEFKAVIELTRGYFRIFGLEDYWFRLSKWSPQNKDKYIDEPENWNATEQMLREVLQEMQVNFVEVDDEASFYGPKVDIQFSSVIGRVETMSTIQLDFVAKKRFGLNFIGKDGKEDNEVFVIHRAPLSTHERFLAFLIEHFTGNFPAWLHPEQVRIIAITDENVAYAQELKDKLVAQGVRVSIDSDADRMQNKIRKAQEMKVPYMLIVGKQEQEKQEVSVRLRSGEEFRGVSFDKFAEDLKQNISARSLDLLEF